MNAHWKRVVRTAAEYHRTEFGLSFFTVRAICENLSKTYWTKNHDWQKLVTWAMEWHQIMKLQYSSVTNLERRHHSTHSQRLIDNRLESRFKLMKWMTNVSNNLPKECVLSSAQSELKSWERFGTLLSQIEHESLIRPVWKIAHLLYRLWDKGIWSLFCDAGSQSITCCSSGMRKDVWDLTRFTWDLLERRETRATDFERPVYLTCINVLQNTWY